ncbi:MAG: glutamine--fructose-6-phosphate transaminase (isomerizing) [Planctomycetes bacterium]|jgi:glucosamine--fructose-6-phosphate aminotransferase (isomerizing)|nr:glutamine--fructose-6-phosphate transaminase (isomerizing) [Planctomycetota bacterium]
MCGIVAYVGPKNAQPVLVEGLKRLEYRGYDSAGLALVDGGEIHVLRSVGRVSVLEEMLEARGGMGGTAGIAHTRWATHGSPTEHNAHPHRDDGGRVALVHNGIIENYATLRRYLEDRGHTFSSETDTEVLAQLIGELYDSQLTLEQAVQAALREVTGAYAIAVVCADEPDTLVVARKGSPLLVGLANGSYVAASDASAIISHTGQVITLEDYQVARLTITDGQPELRTSTIDNVPVTPQVQDLEMSLDEIELGGYPHFMLKEIMEQPQALTNALRGRIDQRDGRVVLGGLGNYARELVRTRRFILTAQGTAWHAALLGEYLFEDLAKVPAETEYASEFRYRNPIVDEGTTLIAISQSGETADTLAALHEARERGALALGMVNVVGSSISRDTDAGVYLHVGPEIGVASTKAFLGQVAVLTLVSLFVGRRRFLAREACAAYLDELERLPELIGRALELSDHIRAETAKVAGRENWLFLGRGYNYPVALEGALKLKEISYIHAEGMPAAEMKHGPIALIDQGMPVVFIAPHNTQYDKVMSNIEEVRARGGRIIAIADEDDDQIDRYAETVFRIPHVCEALQPLITTVPLQLLAYHAAVIRGHDVDKPRNLAKSVTVE